MPVFIFENSYWVSDWKNMEFFFSISRLINWNKEIEYHKQCKGSIKMKSSIIMIAAGFVYFIAATDFLVVQFAPLMKIVAWGISSLWKRASVIGTGAFLFYQCVPILILLVSGWRCIDGTEGREFEVESPYCVSRLQAWPAPTLYQ